MTFTPNALTGIRTIERSIGDDTNTYNPREDDKEYLFTNLLDSLENQVIRGADWWKEQSKDQEGITDDIFRLVGGGAMNLATAITYIPGVKQLGQMEDWLAAQARDLSGTLTPGLDPRIAGWGTRILTGMVTDKALGKISKVAIRQAFKRLPAETVYAAGPEFYPARNVPLSVKQVRTIERARANVSKLKQQLYPIQTRAEIRPRAQAAQDFGAGFKVMTPEHIADVSYQMKKLWGMEDGVFVWDQYVTAQRSGVERAVIGMFEAPESVYSKLKATRDAGLSEMREMFRPLLDAWDVGDDWLQVHHVAALKAGLPLYDGLKYGSQEWWDLTERLLLNNVRPGDFADYVDAAGNVIRKGNYKFVIGHGARKATGIGTNPKTPHSVAHQWYRDIIGESGEIFFTEDRIRRIRQGERLSVADEYANQIREVENIVDKAMDAIDEVYVKPGEGAIDPNLIAERFSKLNNEGKLNTIADIYQIDVHKDIIDSIKARLDSLPVLTPSQRTASIDELFKQFKYLDKDWWRTLNVTEKMRRMKEITGYTYEQLVQYVDAGWITPEQLDKLFNPPF